MAASWSYDPPLDQMATLSGNGFVAVAGQAESHPSSDTRDCVALMHAPWVIVPL